MLLRSVENAIIEHKMLCRGQRILVAVSGGLDSMVLLDVLHRLAKLWEFDLAVGHVDHGLRGAASDRDARFVESIAEKRQLLFEVSKVPEEAWHAHRKLGYEAAARAVRLECLTSMARSLGMDRIALGHTLNDQAETFLYRLARGTGPKGLRGIPVIREPFVRPLLSISRRDIHRYALDHDLAWHEDGSNMDVSIARNRIRHRVLPELVDINPQVLASIQRACELIGDEHDIAHRFIHQYFRVIARPTPGAGLKLDQDRLVDLPLAWQRMLLREAVETVRGGLEGVHRTHIDSLCAWLARRPTHGELSFPQLQVRAFRNWVILSAQQPLSQDSWEMPVRIGETLLPPASATLQLSIVPREEIVWEDIRADRWLEAVDAERVNFPLLARSRRHGDRFLPIGFNHTVKLKDLFINQHVPSTHRNRIPVICDSDRILWVAGYRLSDCVKITPSTQRVLLMRMKGLES